MTDSPDNDAVLAKIHDLAEKGAVRMAPTIGLDSMPDEHTKLTEAVRKVCGLKRIWFSDMSRIGDVFDGKEDPRIDLLARELGVPVSSSDSVVEVCLRLRARPSE